MLMTNNSNSSFTVMGSDLKHFALGYHSSDVIGFSLVPSHRCPDAPLSRNTTSSQLQTHLMLYQTKYSAA